jgi:peptidoglycan hydrolase-like protein with peptidoglycan-binding domain
MMREEFINSIKEGALKGYKEYGILPSLTIAQAALESGWGTSQLSQRANNLFGIKAFSDWTGKRISLPTTEWYGGEMKIINAEFRAYDSLNDSIEDHNRLLSYNRYKPVRECTDYKDACKRIYQCGYATDPRYPEKLISIIEKHCLFTLDEGGGIQEAAVTGLNNKVWKFQHLCNLLSIRDRDGMPLEEDNILGEKTKSCIRKMPVLMLGTKGAAVEFVQEIMNIEPIDGDFGSITERGVLEYQRDHNISIDGVVGTETWTTLLTA